MFLHRLIITAFPFEVGPLCKTIDCSSIHIDECPARELRVLDNLHSTTRSVFIDGLHLVPAMSLVDGAEGNGEGGANTAWAKVPSVWWPALPLKNSCSMGSSRLGRLHSHLLRLRCAVVVPPAPAPPWRVWPVVGAGRRCRRTSTLSPCVWQRSDVTAPPKRLSSSTDWREEAMVVLLGQGDGHRCNSNKANARENEISF